MAGKSISAADLLRGFDLLPDSAVIDAKQTRALMGDLSVDSMRRDPELQKLRVQLSERRFGFSVGGLRNLIRQRTGNAAA